jgi:short-subunit dehydrogenase
MQIAGSTALVTGAGRGLGSHFVRALLDRGAAKVYATARRPVDLDGAVSLPLDVTLLINNAGIAAFTDLVTGDLATIRREMETNFFGPLQVIRAFAPGLKNGAILNVLSALSWATYPGSAGYAASKSAAWSLTNSVRLELLPQRTLVSGLVMASTDTDMMAGFDIPKNDPAEVVRAALDGLEAGEIEIIADADSAAAKAGLSEHPTVLYPMLLDD